MEKIEMKVFYIIDETRKKDFWFEVHAQTLELATTYRHEIYLDQPQMRIKTEIDKTLFPGGCQHKITVNPK